MCASFAELIASLGGDRAVADLLSLSREQVKAMRRRDSVAAKHWVALAAAAAHAGLEVEVADFARWVAEPQLRSIEAGLEA